MIGVTTQLMTRTIHEPPSYRPTPPPRSGEGLVPGAGEAGSDGSGSSPETAGGVASGLITWVSRPNRAARFPIPVLAQEFSNMVKKNGRITEMLLVMKLFLKTNPFAAMGNWRMGIDLMKTGRFSLATEHIKQRGDLGRMLDAVDAKKEN